MFPLKVSMVKGRVSPFYRIGQCLHWMRVFISIFDSEPIVLAKILTRFEPRSTHRPFLLVRLQTPLVQNVQENVGKGVEYYKRT